MRRAVAPLLLAALAAGACSDEPEVVLPPTTITPSSDGPSTSSRPTSSPAAPRPGAPDAVTPEGFARVRATVTEADGTVCELCLWLADSVDRRSRGLMFVTDLGDADGMAFVYPTLHSGTFWMKDTPLPLSIAFFDVGGTYVAAFDMEPCMEGPCGSYRTPDDFLVAIETTRGGLADLGIGPGSVLELSDLPCEPS